MDKNSPPNAQALSWLQSPAPVPYPEAMAAMDARVNAILDGAAGELIWLLEHPALYVGGTSAQEADLLEPSRLPVFHAGRGGQYTYHGPGQRVVYAMMDLARRNRDLRAHVWRLEEWAIRTLAVFGVRGERRAGRVGVWVETQGTEKKIAALGVRCRRWVTSHGLALNVAPDLAAYTGIVPCGIKGYGVTSFADLGVNATMEDVDEALRKTFPVVFG